MSGSEYQELVEFLAVRFTKIDERFTRMDERFDRMDERFDRVDARFEVVEQRLTRAEVLGEQNQHTIQIVAEGVANVYRRTELLGAELADFRREVDQRFQAVVGEMNARFETVDLRFEALTQEMRSGFADVQRQLALGSTRNDALERRVRALEE